MGNYRLKLNHLTPAIYRTVRLIQLERAYPKFAEFLRLKQVHDPDHLFQSDWWRHHHNHFFPM